MLVLFKKKLVFYFIQLQCNRGIVYKKTDEWYNE